MTLKNFIATTKAMGLAKPNRFTVFFQAPATLANAGPFGDNLIRNIALFCSRATLPGLSLSTNSIRTTGEVINMPYDRNFDNCSLTFYADAGMNARFFFEEWINSIQDREDRTFAWYDDFTIPKMIVWTDTRDNTPTYGIEMYNVYPKSVSSTSLSYGDNGIMEITVTFEYRFWKSKQYVNGTETSYSSDSFGFGKDIFTNLQGGLSLNLNSTIKTLGGSLNSITKLGSSVLSGAISTAQSAFGSLSTSIAGINNLIPGGLVNAGNTSLINSLASQAKGYASMATNMGIQLGTPGGLNIAKSSLTAIGAQLGNINATASPSGPIASSIAGFVPNTVGGITTQLNSIGAQLNSVGSSLASANNAINTGILTAASGSLGVSLNVPRG